MVGPHLDHRVYSTAMSVVGACLGEQGVRESGQSMEAANACVQNDHVGPQDARLKVLGGFAKLANELLQPCSCSWAKVRAIAEMRGFILVELIGAKSTEAEHGEVVGLEASCAIHPELLAVNLAILAKELRDGQFNIVESDLHAHRRLCSSPFVLLARHGSAMVPGCRGLPWWRLWMHVRGACV